jgi:F-type H+-transporting ATPase subunit gamma
MAGGRERALRARIKSINSTKKITKAMELIAAARIVKAVGRIGAARTYYREICGLAAELVTAQPGSKFPLLEPGDGPSVYIALTSDRGLCGNYNAAVIKAYREQVEPLGDRAELVAVGRRLESYLHFHNHSARRQVNHVTHLPSLEQAFSIVNPLIREFSEGKLEKVSVISNRFYSMGVQRVEVTQLMPINREGLLDGDVARIDFEAEPSLEAATEVVLKKLVVAEFFGLLLEASAAEHAARQRAMKNATDNASELVRTLTRVMNRVRQDSITTEITEIVGGAEALKQASVAVVDER